MSTVQEIETAVSRLSASELADFRVWFRRFETQHQDDETAAWNTFAAQAFNATYGDDEPDYTLADVKTPNPAYNGK